MTNLKVLKIFYDCCFCGLTCEYGLNRMRRQLEEMQPRILEKACATLIEK